MSKTREEEVNLKNIVIWKLLKESKVTDFFSDDMRADKSNGFQNGFCCLEVAALPDFVTQQDKGIHLREGFYNALRENVNNSYWRESIAHEIESLPSLKDFSDRSKRTKLNKEEEFEYKFQKELVDRELKPNGEEAYKKFIEYYNPNNGFEFKYDPLVLEYNEKERPEFRGAIELFAKKYNKKIFMNYTERKNSEEFRKEAWTTIINPKAEREVYVLIHSGHFYGLVPNREFQREVSERLDAAKATNVQRQTSSPQKAAPIATNKEGSQQKPSRAEQFKKEPQNELFAEIHESFSEKKATNYQKCCEVFNEHASKEKRFKLVSCKKMKDGTNNMKATYQHPMDEANIITYIIDQNAEIISIDDKNAKNFIAAPIKRADQSGNYQHSEFRCKNDEFTSKFKVNKKGEAEIITTKQKTESLGR